jgi:hypothetical protein
MAVLVDVDRNRRAPLQHGPALISCGHRLLAVLDAELGQRGKRIECLVEAPRLVDVHLQREVTGDAANRPHPLDVEPVSPAELELEPPEATESLLGPARHVVGIAQPDRPARRRPGAAQPEQPPDRLAEQLPLQVVKSRVDGGPRRELARGQPLQHVLERERIVPDGPGVLLDVCPGRLDRLAVAVDRLRLAEARHPGVAELDHDDALRVARAA